MNAKKIFRVIIFCLLIIPFGLFLSACSEGDFSIQSIEYSRTEGTDTIYTITYSNGSTSEFVIKDGTKAIDVQDGIDGKDGVDGSDGENGQTPYIKDGYWYIGEESTGVVAKAQDGQTPYIGENGNWWIGSTDLLVKAQGQDGKNITIEDIYNKYVEFYGEIEFSDFLDIYFKDIKNEDQTKVINRCLLSSVKIYTQFRETSYGAKKTTVYGGSGVIYKVEDDYTYIITNYHVVYDEKANSDNGGNLPQKIIGYLYGSESKYISTENNDEDEYQIYDYGSYGIEMEYVGGAATCDIAIIKAKTADIKAINPQIEAIKFAESYSVGETAIAIGNAIGEGISATVGIVSVDNETTSLSVDGTTRNYRSIRIETPIYHGNSGGGLFNTNGELIGITNSGTETYENINYAIPFSIVKNIAENIMYYAFDGDDNTVGAYKILIGCTVQGVNSKYVYDKSTGLGNIVEEILIINLTEDSISTNNLGLQVDDVIISMIINDTTYVLNRNFEIGDLILSLRAGDSFAFGLKRDGQLITSNYYLINADDLINVA